MSFNQSVIEEFRANAGRVGGPFEGGDLLLLTTTGARSGRPHTVPLGYVRDGGRLLVVGSAGGSPRHPAWYHNLLAAPSVHVEVPGDAGIEEFDTVAVPAEGELRERLFARVVAAAPGYADYQAKVDRPLPVVVLERPGPVEVPEGFTGLAAKLVEVHAWLRAQLANVRTEAEAYFAARAADPGPAAPPPLGMQLRQHCLAFCQFLHFHHTAEDGFVFPALGERYPHLAGPLERLRAEHEAIARVQGELTALIADLPGAEPARFHAELDRLSEELIAHLEYEERSLLPALSEITFPPAG
ncbi:nitroreductase/quinone reductase family protein [Bailinhaonella thermotolerans]|uniref:Nitroreductase family deazaflavin-dependent oxidoreductase n=1 Tax=Bailinhaonella thermotolerans TaxID=1070861 RepID=A0A3A4AF74_9ACTN|nr:nitroreductase/quinone reductase family protein [Bailinhaonella thermotolerans]RJL27161.1 nitroreductase family deazaflavin-dependent oxidoreductase [Bailinhaonella thermotolerans]